MAARSPDPHLVAIVPVRGLERAKTRLGEVLDAEERQALVHDLLARAVRAAIRARRVADVVVVTPDQQAAAMVRRLGARTVIQGTGELNEGLALGRAEALRLGAGAILVVPADLPEVTPRALDDVVVAAGAAPVVALVPDRGGQGTNALLLAPPDVIPFAFGPASRGAHGALALAAGARLVELGGPLSLDLDTADDLLAAEGALAGGAARGPGSGDE